MTKSERLPFMAAALLALGVSAAVLLSPASAVAQECQGQQCRIRIPYTGQEFTQSCATTGDPGAYSCVCNNGQPDTQNAVIVVWNNCPDGLLYP